MADTSIQISREYVMRTLMLLDFAEKSQKDATENTELTNIENELERFKQLAAVFYINAKAEVIKNHDFELKHDEASIVDDITAKYKDLITEFEGEEYGVQ